METHKANSNTEQHGAEQDTAGTFIPFSMRNRKFHIAVEAETHAWVELKDRETGAFVRFDADGKVQKNENSHVFDLDQAGTLVRQTVGVSLADLVSGLMAALHEANQQALPTAQMSSANRTETPLPTESIPSSETPFPSGYVVGTRCAFFIISESMATHDCGGWQTGIVQSDSLDNYGRVSVLCDEDSPGLSAGKVWGITPEQLRILDVQFPAVVKQQVVACGGPARCPYWNNDRRRQVPPTEKRSITPAEHRSAMSFGEWFDSVRSEQI